MINHHNKISFRRFRVWLNKRQIKHFLFILLFLIAFTMLCGLYFHTFEYQRSKVEIAMKEETQQNTVKVTSSLIQLRNTINYINTMQEIKNFDGNITDRTIILVIQVHKRIAYLRGLIESLRSVEDISSVILIFSHDYFDEEINKLVNSIDFAPVMQIFLPFSIQLYPNEFPGLSPNDCPWNLSVEKAKQLDCQGAQNPDQYGHYRQGEVTQIKHHWWWKINRVFDQLRVTDNFNGFVLFLEEDYYVAPDILHTLRLMVNFAAVNCPSCNSFHLGTFTRSMSYQEHASKVSGGEWNNLGLSFNRSFWQILKACSPTFCTFDDYNWDGSYQFAAQQCFSQKLTPLIVHASRVLHVGDCGGMHNNRAGCDADKSVQRARNFVKLVRPFLFPKSLTMLSTNFKQPQAKRGWGGFADPRDIQLCLNFSSLSIQLIPDS
ncbi:alpha-1,6-mannosyl-glycoprotein 2-beta-N-acetylglucosaminyltransferase-like [Homalodisca vitripennis]|uniref:alpha-1,6-mannosyl-glycoprotein 2-beta-N-acetylglucosaminyltransferase-like n=1 Tax=Homalodisca vitripennis TaxID=197043 RepID=UPI001EEA3D0D|nr:alpha-1,6-mannosyl-glycoprotein 2-beta-N-acetylglucosaminyltransferase-like [Homalodisca vitripennis]